MDIYIVNTPDGFHCATDDDCEKKRTLRRGEVYKCRLTLARNYAFLKKYFALIRCAWEYLDERQQNFFHNDVDNFRKTLELSCGWCDRVYNARTREFVEQVRSIAFDKMEEWEFNKLYSSVRDAIFQIILPKISTAEFERNLSNF